MGGEGRSTTTRRVGRDFVVGDNSRHKKALPEFCVSVCVCVCLCAVCALLMSGRAICRPGTVQLVEHWKILYCFSCIERRRHRASAL